METILNCTDDFEFESKLGASPADSQRAERKPPTIIIGSASLAGDHSASKADPGPADEQKLRTLLEHVGVQVYMKTLDQFVQEKVSGFAQLSKDLLESGYSLSDFIKGSAAYPSGALFKALGEPAPAPTPPFDMSKTLPLSRAAPRPPAPKPTPEVARETLSERKVRKLRRIKKTRKRQRVRVRQAAHSEARVQLRTDCSLSSADFSQLRERIFAVLSGAIPQAEWLEAWSQRAKQVFWLLMNKMWILPRTWVAELQSSAAFPRAQGVPSQKVNNILKYSSFVLRDILNHIIYSEDFRRSGADSLGDFLLARIGDVPHLHNQKNFRQLINPCVSTKERLYLGKKFRIVKTKLSFSKMQRTFVFRYLRHFPGIEALFRSVKRTYLVEGAFSDERRKIIMSQIALAIHKVDQLVAKASLPAQGICMTRAQKSLLDSVKVSVFLKDWVDYFNWIQSIMNSCCTD